MSRQIVALNLQRGIRGERRKRDSDDLFRSKDGTACQSLEEIKVRYLTIRQKSIQIFFFKIWRAVRRTNDSEIIYADLHNELLI